MESLGDILKQLCRTNYRLRDALALEQLQKNWPKVAEEPLVSRVQPQNYRNKTLFLAAHSAVWSQQVGFLKNIIVAKYKNLLPNVFIKEVRIKSTGFVPERAKPAVRAERKICPSCGRRFEGTEAECISCRNQKQNALEGRIRKYLEDTPWAAFAQAGADLPGVREKDFAAVKHRLEQQTLDALQRLYFEFYQQPLPARSRPLAERLASRYIMLKTGLTPDKINDSIISGQLSRKLHKFIYG
jgi:hypothetical protein